MTETSIQAGLNKSGSNAFNSFDNLGLSEKPAKLEKRRKNARVSAPAPDVSEVKDKFELVSQKISAAKRQNGLIEKAADFVKDKTGIGLSAAQIERRAASNRQSEEALNRDIKNYRRSQENIMQVSGDIVSSAASMYTFFKLKQSMDLFNAGRVLEGGMLKNTFNNKTMPVFLGALAAAAAGGLSKYLMLRLNRIGTKQYKPELNNEMKNHEKRTAKSRAARDARNASFRNTISGAVNGLTVPVISVLGPWGAPVYAALNSLNRYFIASREDKNDKSLSSYIDNIKNSPFANTAAAAALMIPAVIKGKSSKTFDFNLNERLNYYKGDVNLVKPYTGKTTYEKLEEILFADGNISSILHSGMSETDKIQALNDKNIFALKFLQIQDGSNALTKGLTTALRESCPPSRGIDEARSIISKAFSGQYEIIGDKPLGTGTVAETYLVKEKDSGKEFCIKILKKGITEKKINDDMESFIRMIDKSEMPNAEKSYLIDNIKSIAAGVKSELNLKNEMESAKALAKVTKKAKLVQPVKVSADGAAYVMEKAEGISLAKLLEKLASGEETLSTEDAKKLISLYQDVLVEQFSKVNANGKIIHGDIHPGNIIIDLNALKNGRDDCFTLIDTGNTIVQNAENAIRFMNLSKYISNGDTENIAHFVLKDAKLPAGMSEKDAFEKVNAELRRVFFEDPNADIGMLTNDTLMTLADNILQKLKIIPADTQGNLMKAKNSAETSLQAFTDAFLQAAGRKAFAKLAEGDLGGTVLSAGESGKDYLFSRAALYGKQLQQEKLNFAFSPLKYLKAGVSKSAPKHDSVDYINFKLKQSKSKGLSDKQNGIMGKMFGGAADHMSGKPLSPEQREEHISNMQNLMSALTSGNPEQALAAIMGGKGEFGKIFDALSSFEEIRNLDSFKALKAAMKKSADAKAGADGAQNTADIISRFKALHEDLKTKGYYGRLKEMIPENYQADAQEGLKCGEDAIDAVKCVYDLDKARSYPPEAKADIFDKVMEMFAAWFEPPKK